MIENILRLRFLSCIGFGACPIHSTCLFEPSSKSWLCSYEGNFLSRDNLLVPCKPYVPQCRYVEGAPPFVGKMIFQLFPISAWVIVKLIGWGLTAIIEINDSIHRHTCFIFCIPKSSGSHPRLCHCCSAPSVWWVGKPPSDHCGHEEKDLPQ